MSVQYFKDPEKKVLNEKLLDSEAERIAKSFFQEPSGKFRRRVMVSSNQLRKFYNEIKSLEKKLDSQSFEKIYPLVKMVKSKVAYATAPSKINKNEEAVYGRFKAFITENIDSIPLDGEKEFRAFCKFFEAVVGFYYGNGGK